MMNSVYKIMRIVALAVTGYAIFYWAPWIAVACACVTAFLWVATGYLDGTEEDK